MDSESSRTISTLLGVILPPVLSLLRGKFPNITSDQMRLVVIGACLVAATGVNLIETSWNVQSVLLNYSITLGVAQTIYTALKIPGVADRLEGVNKIDSSK